MSDGHSIDSIVSLTLGTAGHIDHGKTALVRALTGIEADRLKEERLRGMTIDLGYAFYETRKGRRIGIIDVPGHEKFVRNMVTGAASVDLVVLVVAADDGVMPQTREHLDIMTVMGIRNGLVALTKIDLVDDEMVELAGEDVKELVKGTFLEGKPVVPLSSQTGEGMERFIDHLEVAIDETDRVSPEGLFRLPVQRVFSAKGFGTVVTGVPLSGTIRVGDPVEVLPPGLRGKVRGLQAFGRQFEEGRAGHRVAANLSDVNYHEVSRGCVVVTPGLIEATGIFEGRFAYFGSLDFPLRNRTEVKVHSGTAEEMGVIVLLNAKELLPGEEAFVQIRLERPMVVAPGDPFLIRRHSPALSLGGGRILSISGRKAKRFKPYVLEPLEGRGKALAEGPEALIAFEMGCWPEGAFTPRDLVRALGQPPARVEAVLGKLESEGEVEAVGKDAFLHRKRFRALAESVEEALDQLHTRNPLKPWIELNALRALTGLEARVLQILLKRLESECRILAEGKKVRRPDHEVRLTEKQQAQAETLKDAIHEASLSPPTLEEAADRLGADPEELADLAQYLVEAERLVRIPPFLFSAERLAELEEAVIRCCREEGEVVIPKIRDAFGTTRKYMIPLMEHLDAKGVTRREGDRRFLKSGG